MACAKKTKFLFSAKFHGFSGPVLSTVSECELFSMMGITFHQQEMCVNEYLSFI